MRVLTYIARINFLYDGKNNFFNLKLSHCAEKSASKSFTSRDCLWFHISDNSTNSIGGDSHEPRARSSVRHAKQAATEQSQQDQTAAVTSTPSTSDKTVPVTDTPKSSEKILTAESKVEEEDPLSEDLLKAIGKRLYEDRELAPALHSEFAVRWEEVITKGLPEEERLKLIKKYALPKNCSFANPPKLNKELKSFLDNTVKDRDTRIVLKQETITTGLAAISKAISMVFKDGKDVNSSLIECLCDAQKLFANNQREESITRRKIILVNINPVAKDALAETTCGEFLFGDKLEENVKTIRSIESIAKDLRKNKNSKNWERPSRPHRNQRTSGGPKFRKPFNKKHRHQNSGFKKPHENQNQKHRSKRH